MFNSKIYKIINGAKSQAGLLGIILIEMNQMLKSASNKT